MGLPRKSKSDARPKEPMLKDVASTPIASKRSDSPPWLGDDSPIPDSPSPIPFMCTQDAGENEVIWNFNSPKSRRKGLRVRDTPVRKRKEMYTFAESPVSSIRSQAGKRRLIKRASGFKNEYIKELSALNKCIIQIQESKKLKESSTCSNEENVRPDIMPLKHINERLLKCENDGIESDDSMNEHLFQASQLAEKQIVDRVSHEDNKRTEKKFEKSILNNDSFDNLLSNINDSYIEEMTQAPDAFQDKIKSTSEVIPDDSLSDLGNLSALLNGSILSEKKKFGRHQSMPMSPNIVPVKTVNPNSSFGRHNSMPLDTERSATEISSSMCTQLEIQRKRKAAMEKLMSKKQHISKSNDTILNNDKITDRHISDDFNSNKVKVYDLNKNNNSKKSDQEAIERKRREALQRLQKKKSMSSQMKR